MNKEITQAIKFAVLVVIFSILIHVVSKIIPMYIATLM